MRSGPILSMRNIHLSYGQTQALNGVDFDLQRGEIHALIGEHRAGKSSLVRILSGAAQDFVGTISLDGQRIDRFTPQSSLQLGVGIVYQELTVIPDVDALENIFTGHMLKTRLGTLNRGQMRERARELFDWLGYDFDVEAPLFKLTAPQQHMVEFARACSINPRVLILDELSNKLTPAEMKKIYRAVLDLKDRGTGVIYISHDSDEILRLAETVTILKDGHRRGTESVRNLDKYRLFQLTYSFSLGQEQTEIAESRFAVVKRHLENIIHSLSAGILVLDTSASVQLFNYAASELFGFAVGVQAGQTIGSILSASRLEAADEILGAIDRHESAHWENLQLSAETALRISVSPLLDEEGTIIGDTIIMEDRSLSASLNEYVVQSEKMASMAEVAVGVAHEINNPLFIIKNYLELVRQRNKDGEIAGKLEKIDTELRRIVEIVSSLLSFSRSQPSGSNGADVRHIVDELMPLLMHRFSEKSVQLSQHHQGGRSVVVMEENRLKQVLINLLMNSVDAVLDSGHIRIATTWDRESDAVVLTISDDGYGIPEAVAPRVFSPFFTTKVDKRSTGLGLSICKHLIEAHGGTIGFESNPGEGTTFTVSLPAVPS